MNFHPMTYKLFGDKFEIDKRITTGHKYTETKYRMENPILAIKLYRDVYTRRWMQDAPLSERKQKWVIGVDRWLDYKHRVIERMKVYKDLEDDQVIKVIYDAIHDYMK